MDRQPLIKQVPCDTCGLLVSTLYKTVKKCKSCRRNIKKLKVQIKIQKIREQGSICPCCLHDFSGCDDYALDMIFETCHVHANHCRKTQATFYACRKCNNKQRQKCGVFENGKFVRLCAQPSGWRK